MQPNLVLLVIPREGFFLAQIIVSILRILRGFFSDLGATGCTLMIRVHRPPTVGGERGRRSVIGGVIGRK